ncbi:nucleolin-like [Cyprinodon tularosa]|uniref:nucleolin-like n=1 Tax=Cyprinodon tularosa TaxID=77115 RepID=UPI0018E26471|nr:nucleolin-like [Cyprinodon tularosa]
MQDFEDVEVEAEEVRSFSGESPEVSSEFSGYDTTSSEDEDDEEEDHLPPHLQSTQRISPDLRFPWNHEEPEESPECQEVHVSRKRRREEDEEDDEDEDHLPPHLRSTQRISPVLRFPWNHEEPEECQEDRVSRRRRREEDPEEELPGKRPCHERDV